MAIVLGLGIMSLFIYWGNKTKGPLENLLGNMASTVHKVEDKIILKQRENRRADKLVWFNSYRNNIEKLKHPKIIIFGASDIHTESIIDLEDSLNTTFPLIHIYEAWGSKAEEEFPELQVKTILELGSVPVITWEPWLSDFDEEKFPGIPKVEDRDKNCLAAIARGTYDSYIVKWAERAKEIQSPIFLRLGHEMNDPYRYPWGPQNNKPKDYVAAWKHVHDIFKKEGASNVIWIWGPHLAHGYFEAFYPGDAYVDYVGVGVMNYGTVANWSQWWTFPEIFGNHYKELIKFNKPIMICELGCLNVGGDRAKWFSVAFDSLPQKYPAVKSIMYFHYPADKTTTDKAVSWYIKDDPKAKEEIIRQIKLWPDSLKPR